MKPNIDPHKISVYTASAGSGKTYTLTRAYIRLAVTGEPWHERQAAAILAITFTNAAAADMKRKIMETLAQIASGEDAAADLQAGSGLSARQLKERTGKVLRYLLHDYGNFSVQTIDSFVQRVIRPFAFELDLPRTYETDIETDRWVEEIREALLASYGTAGQEVLTRLLDGFLEEMAENEDKGRMEIVPALNRVLGMAFEEKSEAHLKRLAARDESQFPQEVEAFGQRRRACEKAALAIYKEMMDLIKAEQLEADDFHGKSRGFWAFFKNPLRDGRAVLRTFLDGEGKATWRKTVEKGFLVDESRGGAAAALQRLYEKMQALDTARYVYEAALEKNLYALALMKRADDLKNDIQKAEGRVPISEFNRKIHDLLKQTDVPYLYERVGALYRHILVDEFQDTSTLQWENLMPLIENNRASGQWNMVVGDPKQSIYRFRSANVEQMLALREDDALAQNEKLVSNWRSDAGIIAFNNLFYRFLLEGFAPEKAENAEEWARIRNRLQRIYTEHEQFYKTATDRLPDEDAQAVRVCFYEKKTAGTSEDEAAAEPESYEEWNCRLIQAILQRHQPGDVAVLCTRNDRVQTVASYLVENGVKVHTDSSLLLRSSLTVRLLVAALRYMG
ncbi:MAG: UvrD-helicase domain-containing protein, partial [Bacteroidales bacterium]|nr:UvrD-helicase domain-containing protein [Bacteroidales bacterium]